MLIKGLQITSLGPRRSNQTNRTPKSEGNNKPTRPETLQNQLKHNPQGPKIPNSPDSKPVTNQTQNDNRPDTKPTNPKVADPQPLVHPNTQSQLKNQSIPDPTQHHRQQNRHKPDTTKIHNHQDPKRPKPMKTYSKYPQQIQQYNLHAFSFLMP